MRGHVSTLRNSAAAVFLACAVAFLAVPASAETIGGALAKAYTHNSAMNSARAGVRVTDENVPIAKSGYRPIIQGVGALDYTYSHLHPSGSNPSGAFVGGGERATTSSYGVQISQTLF